mmetsp:Transcript_6720/g.7031  ORF Transcript_6720/g.7031 Transcript_6720/m.7031 type:complete len:561 (+) Transcript_6720:29-1711(+)
MKENTSSTSPSSTKPSSPSSPSLSPSSPPSFFKSSYLSYLSLRYLIVRTIGIPIPFLSKSIPIIGGRSLIELIMIIIPFLLTITSGLSVDPQDAGILADYILAITVIIGFRNNILSYLFVMSYERVLYWHKVMGMVSIAIVIIHGFAGWTNQTGLPIFIIMAGMAATYLIKPYIFEVFYYVHIIGIVLLLIFSFLHYAQIFPYVLLVWFADVALRYIVTMKKVTATASLLPGDVIRLTFKKSFNYECGQYCFLLIKEISPFDFHPISISTSPEESIISFHIRQVGGWTRQLGDHISKKLKENNYEKNSIEIEVCVEGPYGSPMIDLENPTYEVLLLISGGIGITPLQSIYNHLIHQSASNLRKFRKVIFIWSVKDRAMVDALYTDKLHSTINKDNQNVPYLPISFQPAVLPPPNVRASRSAHPQQIIPTTETIPPLEIDPESGSSSSNSKNTSPSPDLNSNLVFHNEYYLTQVRSSDSQQHTAGINREVQTWLKFGRPNMKEIFERTTELCKKENISRVGVCVCGPTPMINEVVDLCNWTLLDPRCGTIRFDCHSEVFDF